MRQSPWEAGMTLSQVLLCYVPTVVIARSPERATWQSPWESGDTLTLSLLALCG
jgi:hypothetical protein